MVPEVTLLRRGAARGLLRVRRVPLGLRRRNSRTRCLPHASPRAEVERSPSSARWSASRESRVLPLPRSDDRWHPGDRHSNRLVRRSRIRDLLVRRKPRHGAVESGHGGGEAVRHPSYRSIRVPSDRGGDPELSLRHQPGPQSVRGGTGMARRPRQETRLHWEDGAEADQERRTGEETRGRRSARRRGRAALAPASVARAERREGHRNAHRPGHVAKTQEEHRIRLGAVSSFEAWYRDRNRHARRIADRGSRQEAVHRSEERTSEVVILGGCATRLERFPRSAKTLIYPSRFPFPIQEGVCYPITYVLLTTPDGGIINDPVLLRLGENHFWLSLSDWDVLFWCKGVAVHAGLDVVVREPDVSPLQLQGPKSKDVMVDLFGEEILGLEYYHLTETELDGIPLVITRTGWSAERGYELYLRDSKFGEKLWDAVMAAGSKYEIRPIAPSEIRRIEAGILNYSSDIMLDNNPYEVGLGWTVDEDKHSDYLGKDAIARIKEEGVRRKLVGIEVAGESLGAWIPDYWDVHADGRKVGHVTSMTYSPRLEKNIGYALVGIDHAKIGTRLRVSTTKGVRSASVVKKPFVDPKKDIPKS